MTSYVTIRSLDPMLSRAQELLTSPGPAPVPGFPGLSSLYTGGQRPEVRAGPGGGPMLHTQHSSPLLSQTAAPDQAAQPTYPGSRSSPGIQGTEPMQL